MVGTNESKFINKIDISKAINMLVLRFLSDSVLISIDNIFFNASSMMWILEFKDMYSIRVKNGVSQYEYK